MEHFYLQFIIFFCRTMSMQRSKGSNKVFYKEALAPPIIYILQNIAAIVLVRCPLLAVISNSPLFIYSFIHLFIHSFIYLFIYLFIYSFIHLFILRSIVQWFNCSVVRLFVHTFNYSFTRWFACKKSNATSGFCRPELCKENL